MGKVLTLWSQMMSFASFSVVLAGAVTSLSRGVMNVSTVSSPVMRERR